MPTPIKFDEHKARIDLIPPQAIKDIAAVLTHGAGKYSDHNWRDNGGLAYSRVYAAAQRHMLAFWDGESLDEETGMSHLAHAACCIVFLMSFETEDNGKDDRYV
jgi:hypothetical protein